MVAFLPLGKSSPADDDGDMTTLSLPSTPIAAQALDFAASAEAAPIANHSVRSYLFACLLANHLRMRPALDYDDELLFLACVLHDIGLTEQGNRRQRFEIDGADLAAEFLIGKGLGRAETETVWEAIALHSSSGIAERRGAVCRLTRGGVTMDFGADPAIVGDAEAQAIHAAYPRLGIATAITDAIVTQAKERPEKAPRYTLPGELARERAAAPHVTGLEAAALAGRWGA